MTVTMYQQSFLFLLVFILSIVGLEAQSIEDDGAYLVQENNKAIPLKPCKASTGYFVQNHFTQFWHFPKVYYTMDSTIAQVSSFKKLVLKGRDFDGQTIKKIGLLEIEAIKLGMPFIHSGKQEVFHEGTAYKMVKNSAYPFKEALKLKSISNFETHIFIDRPLEDQSIFAFWIDKSYYMFRIGT